MAPNFSAQALRLILLLLCIVVARRGGSNEW
ncbi:hypothetical protein WH5701_06696 [Synechococcus sp. WH 5701]|nr:hypothetical protein WH5701_06696 [Synechococcus sp. WH 5701]